MKLIDGLVGLILTTSLKHADVDVFYQPVHKVEVRQVETFKQTELLSWQIEYQKYGLQKVCFKKKEAPPVLGNGFARDMYNFYGENERTLNFINDVYRQNFRIDALRVKF